MQTAPVLIGIEVLGPALHGHEQSGGCRGDGTTRFLLARGFKLVFARCGRHDQVVNRHRAAGRVRDHVPMEFHPVRRRRRVERNRRTLPAVEQFLDPFLAILDDRTRR